MGGHRRVAGTWGDAGVKVQGGRMCRGPGHRSGGVLMARTCRVRSQNAVSLSCVRPDWGVHAEGLGSNAVPVAGAAGDSWTVGLGLVGGAQTALWGLTAHPPVLGHWRFAAAAPALRHS
eukprot:CAMPEP_0174291202 /NCGR_PEP_ID=MMETSP0809-20121228/31323_1 /TAXON_ID=73025 ORGANISM="Eutreptiella gymnastica-like, Strain CCMP1594" /NCGR_SAMPLE_ID=MMETSP0809 /ASSEMBLY_ACC=CAM_ASM_000658 /LENGTH=118 /DNA_ID=CAMNT_0015390381 /DNA_START=348 /DNA_END=705 /DNA_ORIENTATION=-